MISKCGMCYLSTGYKKLLGKVRKFGKSVLTLIHPPSKCDWCVQQLVSEQVFRTKSKSLKEIRRHTMDTKEEKVCISVDVVPIFNKHDYFGWRAKMKAFLKKYGVWEIVINAANPSKKKTKAKAQKEAKKNNATTLKFLLDGLPSSIRDSLGEFTSAKELWLKLEGDYQGKMQGKQIEDEPKTEPDPIYDEVDKVLADDENKLMNDSKDTENDLQGFIKNNITSVYTGIGTYCSKVQVKKEEFIKFKDHVVDSFQKHQQRIKEVKDLLRRLKDENTRLLVQLGEKDEEINRLQEEETDDANLESQLEESKRKEEVLKDQLEKKDEALQRQLERARLKEEDLKE
jgi:DNA repair ATPase RecN